MGVVLEVRSGEKVVSAGEDGAVRVDAVVEDKSPGEPAAIVARGLIMDDEGCAKESKVSWPTPGSSVGAATSAVRGRCREFEGGV